MNDKLSPQQTVSQSFPSHKGFPPIFPKGTCAILIFFAFLGKPKCTAIIMHTDLYTNSYQLDELVQEKLKPSLKPNLFSPLSVTELQTEINSLRYLLYVVNSDRTVIFI